MTDSFNNLDLNNPEFQDVWKLIMHTNQSVFLTGKAGTGKSTFLKYICQNTKKKHIILAPTGIAAINVGGNTIHSFFKMPLKPLLPNDPDFAINKIRKTLKYSREKVNIIKELELIIIDEISMVRADIIDFIDKVLRTYSGKIREPFGGKQLLLVGDLFQLEPVITPDMRDILKRCYQQFYFFNANAFFSLSLISIELKKIYRQNNEDFIKLLDRIRVNKISLDDLNLINSRWSPNYEAPDNEFIITLATKRDIVDYINQERLNSISEPEIQYEGKIEGEFPTQNLPTNLNLKLKKGAQVIFVRNDKDQRWINGTLGKISDISKDRIEVELENGNKYALEKETWENILYSYDEKEKTIQETVLGTFSQFPIKTAWALTIHKSQGLTFNKVVIDFTGGAFAGGQTYVALSRCTTLDGIYLKQKLSPRDVFVKSDVVSFSQKYNDKVVLNEAFKRAEANDSYLKSLKYFKLFDLDRAIGYFAKATFIRNDLNIPLIQRFIRKNLNIISKQEKQIKSLKEELNEVRSQLSNLAKEYSIMGKDSLSFESKNSKLKTDSISYKGAKANYEKALKIDPDCEIAYIGLIDLNIRVNRYSQALDYAKELIAKHPTGTNYSYIGEVNYLMGELYLSLGFYRKALKLSPKNHLIHEQIAKVYGDLGDVELMQQHKETAKLLKKKKNDKGNI